MKELQERKQLRVDDVPEGLGITQILPEDVEMLPLQLTDGEELKSSARPGGGGSTSSLLVPVVA